MGPSRKSSGPLSGSGLPGGMVRFGNTPFDSVELTMSRGAYPSTALLRTTPTDEKLDIKVADLEIFWNESPVVILKNAIPDMTRLRIEHGTHGFGVRYHVAVQDRRKVWTEVPIYLEANLRYPNGKLNPKTKKTLKEILEFIFKQLGETVEFSFEPPKVYPFVSWQGVSAARQLDILCRSAALDIVLGLDNKVRIVGKGIGVDPPDDERQRIDRTPLDTFWIPQSIKLIGGPRLFQSRFLLEAVGLDTDGTIQLLDDLSYKPAQGWGADWPMLFSDVAAADRHLAQQSVFRWFRIKEQAASGLDLPGADDIEIVDREQYLPLNDFLSECGDNEDGSYVVMDAIVHGKFYPYSDLPHEQTNPAHFTGKFRVNKERGILELSLPLFRLADGVVSEPDLYLTVSHFVRDKDSRQFIHYEKVKTLDGQAPSIRILHPEITFAVVDNYNDDGTYEDSEDNKADADSEADLYLDAIAREVTASPILLCEYDTAVPIQLDGKMTQCRYAHWNSVEATTTVSVNHEFDQYDVISEYRKVHAIYDTREKELMEDTLRDIPSNSSIVEA